jgi:hypothetical protein
MPFGYCYAEGLDEPTGTKPWNLKIDECREARSISLEHQKVLADMYPFAETAYRFHSDSSFVKSCLIDEENWQPAECAPPETHTDKRWKLQLDQLKGFGVLMTTTAIALIILATYFAIVGKGVARSIFAGKQLSKFFKRPLPVNLPNLPLVLSTISRLSRGRHVWVVTADLRNNFHQIAIHEDVSRIFNVQCDGKMYSWRVMPMGFSYSPRSAQALAWAALLKQATKENGMLEIAARMKKSQHPPSFGVLKDEEGSEVGIVLIWYDNFIVISNNQSIANHMSKALKAMTSSGFVWGEKAMFHPHQLERLVSMKASDLDDDQQTWATALGMQFGLSKRDSQGACRFQWRLKPKTAERAMLLLRQVQGLKSSDSKPLSCRMIAKIVGSAIWHGYISARPLFDLEEVIEITALCAKVVSKTKSWDTAFNLDTEQLKSIEGCLGRIMLNEWQYDWTPQTGETVYVASDASDDKGAWVRLHSSSDHGVMESWDESPDVHIFVKELRAAVKAIQALAPYDGTLVLAIDNTAAAQVLRNFYSSTMVGRDLAKQAFTHLQEKRSRLIAAGVPGLHNYADGPTRSGAAGQWCSIRRAKTWAALKDAQEGLERQEMNPYRRNGSHEDDELELMLEELQQMKADTSV